MSLHLTPTYQIFYTERGAIGCTEFSIKELKTSLSCHILRYRFAKWLQELPWVVTLYDYRTNLLADSALSKAVRFCLSLICCPVNMCVSENIENNFFEVIYLLTFSYCPWNKWVFFYPEQSFSGKDHEAYIPTLFVEFSNSEFLKGERTQFYTFFSEDRWHQTHSKNFYQI